MPQLEQTKSPFLKAPTGLSPRNPLPREASRKTLSMPEPSESIHSFHSLDHVITLVVHSSSLASAENADMKKTFSDPLDASLTSCYCVG